MELTFRPMELADLDDILEIEEVSFPTPWTRQAFTQELTENDLAYYVVAAGEKIQGYGGMWCILDEGHITNIAVRPESRGCGVAKEIFAHLMLEALKRGIRRMTLEVRPSNTVAQHLYRKLGFTAVGRRKGYYSDTKEDAIIMWKELVDGKELEE